MRNFSTDIVICGAGIAGISAAHHLATQKKISNVVLVDPEPPLSVTSDKSFEGYRNFWPGPGGAMVALANRSIDLLETIHRVDPARLHMNRRGYVFASADPDRADEIIAMASESCDLGAGQLRIHEIGSAAYSPSTAHDLWGAPNGVDVILDPAQIRQHFPHLSDDACIVMHARRCGWFAAQQFGMYMLEQARECGVQIIKGEVVDIDIEGGAVAGVRVKTAEGERFIKTDTFVNAAGPGQKQVAQMLGVELPVRAELHMKVTINDAKRIIPRSMPLTIWFDPIELEWSEEERAFLAEDETTRWLLDQQPPIVACRPDGGDDSTVILMQWEFRMQPDDPIFPLPVDPNFPEYVLRGLTRMVPQMKAYIERMPKPYVDGGYYVAAPENRPIIGPLGDIGGAFIIGALSGAGMQLSAGAGELLAAHVTGSARPDYAQAFLLQRFADPAYLQLLDEWGSTGSL